MDRSIGQQGEYSWIQWSHLSLEDILVPCPALVLGQFVCITSCDSGPLNPTPKEKASGWEQIDDIAYSSRIESIARLPRDHYDEWYVFPERARMPQIEVFINYGGFSLADPRGDLDDLDPTWDRKAAEAAIENVLTQQERFWKQMAQLGPTSYIAEGDNTICATRNPEIYQKLLGHQETPY